MDTFDTPRPVSNKPSVNFVALFQEQQAMLKNIMKQQEKMQNQQEDIDKKQEAFQEKMLSLEEHLAFSDSSGCSKQKARVTCQLTVSCCS